MGVLGSLLSGGARRRTSALVALVLAAAPLTGPAGEPKAAAAPPDWVRSLSDSAPDRVGSQPWRGSSSTPLGASKPASPPKVTFPEPARWTASLNDTARAAAAKPVVVAARGEGADQQLTIEVLDRDTTRRLGASGMVFTVNAAPAGKRPATITVDYSGFADAYGAGYADRLGVISLPPCALVTPVPAGCAKAGTRLPVRNDKGARRVAFDVAEIAGGASVFAMVSGVGGDEGTFAASPLSPSGTWQVSPGSGEFTYSYPIPVPAPAGGTAPTVSLGYSSGAIDGMTLANNTQSGPAGLGWSDFANAFIERRYEPCFRFVSTADLCWKGDNATISLGGVTGPLVPTNDAHTTWKVLSDPGWTIERLTGAPYTTIHQGQYWKVTGPDGTIYYFGYGHMPGRQTNSILSVPVLADNPGEPCRKSDTEIGSCDQGWRWYLDRVEDPDGNVQSLLYSREDNWYSGIGGLGGNTKYHRGALLSEIVYGGRDWNPDNYAARVLFETQYRCGFLVAACPAPEPGNTAGFPDVPVDLICAQNSTCTVHAPSFFVGRRYSAVRTEVKIGTAWKPVAQYNLHHSFGDGQDGVIRKLQLESIQQAGIAFGRLNAYPDTTFGYRWLDNRVDHDGNIPKAMRHNRLETITNPLGGTTTVTYGRNRGCGRTYNPYPRWDQNTMDCFPQQVKENQTFTRTGVFNKYLVTQVVEAPGRDSPNITTRYAYGGTPAWGFDGAAFARDEDEVGWSVWRGYGTATITKGSSKTRLRLFRGWDNDPMLEWDVEAAEYTLTEVRRESVSTFDGAQTLVDNRSMAGRTLEEQQLGAGDAVLSARRYGYQTVKTFETGDRFDVEWVGQTTTLETVAAAGQTRQRRSVTTYNAHFQPTTTLEEGWLEVSGDERCSITTYADNPGAGMHGYPATNRSVAGDCASTTVLSQSETYYDNNATLGAPPVRGNPTRQRTLLESGRWAESLTEYDALGRPTRVTGPTGAVTATAYAVTAGAPGTQIPIRTTVTNALGQQSVTDWAPEFGVAAKERDVNGNVTEYGYDEFGRLETVWQPTEPVAFAEPSWRFAYDLPNRSVRTRHLTSDSRCCDTAVFEDTWVVYDANWRERQSQTYSPESGKLLIAETTYDAQGLVRDETVEQAVTSSTPGRYVAGIVWKNLTRHGYDELGREVTKQWFRGTTGTAPTTTAYGADTVTVTGPDGRRARQRVDAFGRTAATEEFDGQAWAASTYGYDLGDRLTSVTDPAGNRITYAVNLAGWRTGQQDPNRGAATFTYDNAGNQTSIADARGNRVFTNYDALGRKLDVRSGSATGALLSSWQYDTAPGGKGSVHRQTAHTAGGDWVTETTGYDQKGRPTGTRLTVPAGVPGLSGQYAVTQTYDRADRVRTVTFPAVGGLPSEIVSTDYDNLGQPTRLASPLNEYVWRATYDDRGRKLSVGLGPRLAGAPWMARNRSYDDDQRVAGTQTYVASVSANGGIVAEHRLAFDPAGNLTEDQTRQLNRTWRECYGYDPRGRLVDAHTVASTATCAAGAAGTGDQPYAHTFGYSPDGKLLDRAENGATTAYTYPAAGAARPHAPTRVGADTYTWDANGNLTGRTVGGDAETLAWDQLNRLSSVTGAAGQTTFVYDPSGQRLLRRTPDGAATLYFAGHEITANAAGTSVTATRSYAFDGELVATRSPAGVHYVISDVDGSVEGTVPSGQPPTATRLYAPYGGVRDAAGDLPTDREFLGQVQDSSTGLSYLNARYYDARNAVFLSADPVYDTAKVKTLNPYGYAGNNPTSNADPSGMYSAGMWGVELQNAQLKDQNKQLVAQIGKLGNLIEDLQGIIKKQQKQITKLINYAKALEAEISRQAGIIRQLQDRVRYLEGIVVAQAREISRLRRVVAYQAGVIRRQAAVIRWQAGVIRYQQGVINFQAGVINYQRGVIGALVNVAIVPEYRATVYNSIVAGTGIPLVRNPGQVVDLGGSEPLVVPPGPWRILGNAVENLERQNAIMAGQLMAAGDHIADLQFESDFHESRRDELYAELHPSMSEDFWSYACDMNSVAGGGYTIATGTAANPYVAGASAGFGIYCVLR